MEQKPEILVDFKTFRKHGDSEQFDFSRRLRVDLQFLRFAETACLWITCVQSFGLIRT